jgi:predicted transcriptional regulator
MRCEHDVRTRELPGLGEFVKPATQAKPEGRGAYKVKLNASSWAMRRVAAGLTMKQLAQRAGVSLRTLERLEGQGGDVSLQSRRAIRDALDMAEEYR